MNNGQASIKRLVKIKYTNRTKSTAARGKCLAQLKLFAVVYWYIDLVAGYRRKWIKLGCSGVFNYFNKLSLDHGFVAWNGLIIGIPKLYKL